jgi:hypothetical protein
LVQRALLLLRQGKLSEAQEALESAIANDPADPEAMNGLGILSVLRHDRERALFWFHQAIRVAPGHPEILNNLIDVLLERSLAATKDDRLDEAVAHGLEAFGLADALPSSKPRMSVIFVMISDKLYRAGRVDEAIRMAEAAAQLTPGRPSVHSHLHLLLTARGQKKGNRANPSTEASLGRHFLVTGFPESGLEVLEEAIRSSLGYVGAKLAEPSYHTEDALSESRLRAVAGIDTVSRLHCAATEENISLMRRFAIRPMILVRNVYDTLLSWRRSAFPAVHFLPLRATHDPAVIRQIDIIMAEKAAWLVHFYAEWRRATDRHAVDALWIAAEDAMANPEGTAVRIVRFLGQPCHVEAISDALKTLSSPAGEGVPDGESFTRRQKEAIRGLTEVYPNVDFSPIGL